METFELGNWKVDPLGRRLTHLGDTARPSLRLSKKANEVLMALVAAEGQVVTREVLLDTVWPKVIVGEEVLTHAVAELRRALGDSSRKPSYIETVHKAGYRLLATASGRKEAARAGVNPTVPATGLAMSGVATGNQILLPPSNEDDPPQGAAMARFLGLPGRRESVFVHPLLNMTEDPGQDRICIGLVEDLVTELCRFQSLKVIRNGRSAGLHAGPLALSPATEGADYLLLGSLRRLGPRLRVTIQLVHALSGDHLWAERFDRYPAQLIACLDEIVESVVATISEQITRARLKLTRRQPPSERSAYGHYMLARRYSQLPRRPALVGRVLEESRHAVAADPQFAPGHGMLANAQRWLAVRTQLGNREALRQSLKLARESALQACELDPEDSEALRALGWSYLVDCSYREAEHKLRRSLAASPHDGEVAMSLVTALSYLGQPEEGVDLARRTLRKLRGYPDYFLFDLGHALFFAGEVEQAVAIFDEVPEVELESGFAVAIAAFAAAGRQTAAAQVAGRYADYLRAHWGGDPAADLPERIAWDLDHRHVYSRPEDLTRLREGLREAGLKA